MAEVKLAKKEYEILNTYLAKIIRYFKKLNHIDCVLMSVINYSDDFDDYVLKSDTVINLTVLCDSYENINFMKIYKKINDELLNKIKIILGIEVLVDLREYKDVNDLSVRLDPIIGLTLYNSEIIFDNNRVVTYIKENFDQICEDDSYELVEFNPPLVLK